MFLSDTLPHDKEETQEIGVVNIEGYFYRGCQTHKQSIFQGDTAKHANRSTTKSLAKSQTAHLWSKPLSPSSTLLYFHGRSPSSTLPDTLGVRSQKGAAETTGPFHHLLDAQNVQGQQPED